MELKQYQQQVIDDIALFLDYIQKLKNTSEAFNSFWVKHPRSPLYPFPGEAIEPYKNNIPRVPHICIKVPTAGGKTFIACNAIKTIFDAFTYDKPKTVVWLVPSITILDQTIKNLKNPNHPYRQKINSHFGNKVEVFDKDTLLQGSGFNTTTIKEQLNILVFSFDSLRAKNKEDRKVFQENGNLLSFENLLGKDNDITLGAIINHLNPLVIVDESHNAESELSVDMLKGLNPCFILDLTATPRKNSNIISFVDALELKKDNMVKLPVIVYNHNDKTEVINSSLHLQRRLELQAKEEEKNGGKYIRPIVLFQAQPKNGKNFLNDEDEKSNVQKLKEKLIELQIPEEQIKIKTANINEIRGVDLLSRDCEVRYIITINALKEGWDCPFAYILASLADKSSSVDVEQILGRVLRQPHVMKHNAPLLNMSYVLTASSKFLDTLENIVKGLNKAGFSERDYKVADVTMLEEAKKQEQQSAISYPPINEASEEYQEDTSSDIDVSRINIPAETEIPNNNIAKIEEMAIQQSKELAKIVAEMERNNTISLPNEIKELVKTYNIKDTFKEQAENINIPQFYFKRTANDLFKNGEEEDILLEKEELLKEFSLSKCDINITFENITTDLYKVDLDETNKEHTPGFVRVDNQTKDYIMTHILSPSQQRNRVPNFTKRIMKIIGNIYPIADKEIEKYITRILEDFTDEQFNDLASNEYSYTDKIKQKIKSLSQVFAEERFKTLLDTGKIFTKPSYKFPKQITPGEIAKSINRSLYEKEGKLNSFEEEVINEIGNMENVSFWTRNIDRKGFKINGFINHYPDFIIQMKSGKTILLETKGDHLEAQQKIRLGELWESKAGNYYRYFMVYENREVSDTYTREKFLSLMRDM